MKHILKILSILTVLLLSISVAMAGHTPSGTLDPEWSAGGQLVDYTVELCNEGPDPVDEIRIIKNPSYANVECLNLTPGWIPVKLSPFFTIKPFIP